MGLAPGFHGRTILLGRFYSKSISPPPLPRAHQLYVDHDRSSPRELSSLGRCVLEERRGVCVFICVCVCTHACAHGSESRAKGWGTTSTLQPTLLPSLSVCPDAVSVEVGEAQRAGGEGVLQDAAIRD